MYQSGLDGLLIELSKFSLGQTDLSATVNLFSKVTPNDAGALSYMPSDNTDQVIELRFEMDCLVFLSAARMVWITVRNINRLTSSYLCLKANSLGETDICRNSCPQNQRAFQNNARYYALSNV